MTGPGDSNACAIARGAGRNDRIRLWYLHTNGGQERVRTGACPVNEPAEVKRLIRFVRLLKGFFCSPVMDYEHNAENVRSQERFSFCESQEEEVQAREFVLRHVSEHQLFSVPLETGTKLSRSPFQTTHIWLSSPGKYPLYEWAVTHTFISGGGERCKVQRDKTFLGDATYTPVLPEIRRTWHVWQSPKCAHYSSRPSRDDHAIWFEDGGCYTVWQWVTKWQNALMGDGGV